MESEYFFLKKIESILLTILFELSWAKTNIGFSSTNSDFTILGWRRMILRIVKVENQLTKGDHWDENQSQNALEKRVQRLEKSTRRLYRWF